ncbi:MAG: hypothetical protein JXJ17_05680 [Anaerolineae bacterium]|nr:hypothetical protein [Anaerolineae bacterium]
MKIRGVACAAVCLILTACAIAEKPGETRIIIDGQVDDWAGRDVILEDPMGDAEAGYLDIGAVYAFVNRDALYILAEFDDPALRVMQFDIELALDGEQYLVSWMPGEPVGGVGNIGEEYVSQTEEGFKPGFIRDTGWSSFALGDALEVRIDLRDLDSPETLALTEIRVMAGECCLFPEWHEADLVNPPGTPVVNEVDAPGD